ARPGSEGRRTLLGDELLPAVEREFELLGCDELDSCGDHLRRLLVWRALQFNDLGFDRRAAVELADSPADLGLARGLIREGCPLTCAASSKVSRSSMAGSADGHGCVHRRSRPSRCHSSSAMCGAYGWISETAVSAANRASGAAVSRDSSLASVCTAEIAVLN